MGISDYKQTRLRLRLRLLLMKALYYYNSTLLLMKVLIFVRKYWYFGKGLHRSFVIPNPFALNNKI